MPIYDLAAVKEILKDADNLILATRYANQNAEDLALDTDDISQMIQQLEVNNYRNSEWCKITKPKKNKQRVAAADSYKLRLTKYNEFAHKYLSAEYYLKFFIDQGQIRVEMISIHLDRG